MIETNASGEHLIPGTNIPQVPPPVDREKARPSDGPKSQEEKVAAQSIGEDNNPAGNAYGVTRENRIPINVPELRLNTPRIEGFHLHWFLDRNISRALQAGYQFVGLGEVPTMDRSIGGRAIGTQSGEDLGGARISQIAGTAQDGTPEQLTLMKIPLDWYFDDQRAIAERNLSVLKQVFGRKLAIKEPGESEKDYNTRYTREAILDMSNGRFRKASVGP